MKSLFSGPGKNHRRVGLTSGVLLASIAAALAVGCVLEPGSDLDSRSSEQDLDVTKTSNLTRKNLSGVSNEGTRQADTDDYYDTVGTASNGTGSDILTALDTLSDFRSRYAFGGANEQVARYYNRGDLGIGREMHCVDNITSTGEIACYVTNFAAGDDDSEFTFGQSTSVAFRNMAAGHDFATVAMVYRDNAPAANKVFFVVYGEDGTSLAYAAALDRVGILFATGQNTTSVPGEDFNNHIPSNCINCHGGTYDSATHAVTNARFLPFDLDQFDYEDVSGRRRADQLTAFKKMNEMAWKVAVRSGAECSPKPCRTGPIAKQIDGWYNNTSFQADTKNEVLEGSYNSAFVPAGWNANAQSIAAYRDVVRPSCRGCHIANSFPFSTETDFVNLAGPIAADVCNYQMPHALQTTREFWQSNQPTSLVSYLNAKGKTNEAAQIAACGPGNVVTLDPDKIAAALF